MSASKEAPIGIIDSGVGGLTVAKSLRHGLPREHIIYFGDTARFPYGIKSTEMVRHNALQATDFLLKKGIKLLLIACNTIAASASQEIKKRCGQIPVLDVIEAGSREAVAQSTTTRRIGVIGTLATVGSGAYEKKILELDRDIQVFSRACPLLVPLAEEGWVDNSVARETLGIYLADLRGKQLDTLILGCSHYPLFKLLMKEIIEENVILVDSADAMASMTKEYLRNRKRLKKVGNGGLECFVSDKPQRFKSLAERFLGSKLNRVEIIGLKG